MRFLSFLFFLILSVTAFADGMPFTARENFGQGVMPRYEPERMLTEKRPFFPSQRAVLKWDGSYETMIVESTLAGPRGTYGWVVPLPTRPSFVKAVKPDYVANTFAAVRPPVVPLKARNLVIPGAAALLVAALLLTSGLRYRRLDVATRVPIFFGELLAGAVIMSVAWNGIPMPTASMESGTFQSVAAKAMAGGADIVVESLGTIGSYDVSVLHGEEGKPLMDWLRAHHMQIPDNAQKVIDQYAKEKWFFLAAEFRKDEDRPLPPHPLKAVFPTKEPIYPMRLTGTQDQSMHLEMVVVASRLAQIDNLDAWMCDDRDLLIHVPKDFQNDADVYSDWHGDLYAMAKNGAVVTYLRGDVAPSHMRDDYKVEWRPIQRFQAEVHDRGQAISHAYELALLWLPFLAAFFGLAGTIFLAHSKLLLPIGALAAFALACTVGEGWLLSVKTVDTEESSYSRPGFPPGVLR